MTLPTEKKHNLLQRQLRRCFGESFEVPAQWIDFLEMVNRAYYEADADRKMLERSLELSSQELLQANADMRAIFEAVPDVFLRIDKTGKILDCKSGNPIDSFDTGGNLVGTHIDDWPFAPIAGKFRQTLSDIRFSREPASFEYALPFDSTEIFYEARLIPLPDDQAVAVIRDITERKDAQSALNKTVEIYNRLVNAIPDIVIRADPTGNILFANDNTLRISGYRREELEGRHVLEFIAPDDRLRAVQTLSKMTSEKIGPREFRLVMKDGREIPFEINGDVLLNQDGTPFGSVHVCRDITDRKQAESALRETEKRFRLITDNVRDTVWLMDMNLQPTWISPSAEQTHGFALAELRHLPLEHHVTPQSHQTILRLIENNITPEKLGNPGTDISVETEIEFVHKDDSTHWADTVITLLRDASGLPTGFLGLARDTTERRKMEEALRESEQKYRLITERITDIVWIADMKLQTLYISPSIRKVLGFDQQERLYCPLDQMLTPDSLTLAWDIINKETRLEEQKSADPNRTVQLTLEYYHQDGTTRWMETVVSLIRNEQNEVVELYGVSRDITDRKKAEEALQTAHAELENHVAERTRELTLANDHLKDLFRKQDVNIDLAKNILTMINNRPVRHQPMVHGIDLFCKTCYQPCYAEGGDHFFVKDFPGSPTGPGKTALSLKDQSGHEVSCVLRSIITDIVHHALLVNTPNASLENIVADLNKIICSLTFFGEDNFCTAINAEIDHLSLTMRYVSSGHPPFLFIRNRRILCLPGLDSHGRTLPIGVCPQADFTAEELQLQPGDKFLLFTDGLTDMPHALGKPVLSARDLAEIVASIVNEQPDLPISQMMDAMFSRIHAEKNPSGSYDDDITILGLELESTDWTYEDTVYPTDPEHFYLCVRRLFETVSAEWRQNGFAAPDGRLRMVLEEAMANAWIHGNRKNPHKKIVVRRRYGNDAVLEIFDEGKGFDVTSSYDPTCKENVTKPGGRGNFIMRLYTEDVQWKDGGRRVTAYFAREDTGRHGAKSVCPINLWQRHHD